MRCVTYNIQYGIGMDGRYDLERIIREVEGADVIAFQELSRNNPQNRGVDMVEGLKALLPGYFSVTGFPFGVDMGSAVEKGVAITRLFEFGNAIFARYPIVSTRTLLLPRTRSYDRLNFQRCALEALIATPLGPIRFYSVHLDHTSPDERIAQCAELMSRVNAYGQEGGALTGVSEMGFPEPPLPEAYVMMGDFNFTPDSPEYVALCGRADVEFGLPARFGRPLDAAVVAGSRRSDDVTWTDPQQRDNPARRRCLDYVFLQASLGARVTSVRIDGEATGSDHRPVWLEME